MDRRKRSLMFIQRSKRYFVTLLILTVFLALSLVGCASNNSTGSNNAEDEMKQQLTEMPNFESTDLNGNAITGDVFSNKKFTVVNFWGTYCSPCISEMKELAEWSKGMEPDVQLIGVVCDVDSQGSSSFDTAVEICNSKGVKFTNVLANDSLAPAIQTLVGIPTTYIVDSNRQVVAGPIVGAQVDAYKQALQDCLAK